MDFDMDDMRWITKAEEEDQFAAPKPFRLSFMEIENGTDKRFTIAGSNDADQPRPSRGQNVMHQHPYYEIVYVLDGEFTQHMENGVCRSQKGDAYILNRNAQHYEGFETDCSLAFVGISPELSAALYHKNKIVPAVAQYKYGPILAFFADNNRRYAWLDKAHLDFACTLDYREKPDPPASQILREMAREIEERDIGYAFRIQALLLRFFAELENPKRYHLTHIRLDCGAEDFIFGRLSQYLAERKRHVTRAEIAEGLHYNADYLNRVAKKRTGLSLSELNRKLAMGEAKRLLSETDESIASIIARLGYTNRTHFYRLFREETGVSPMEYRNAAQKPQPQ